MPNSQAYRERVREEQQKKELKREGLCFRLGWQEVVAEGQSGTLIPGNKECWKTRYPFLIRPRWWIGWRKANRDKTDPWWQQTNFDVLLTLIAVRLVWADVFEEHGKMAFNLSAESEKPWNRPKNRVGRFSWCRIFTQVLQDITAFRGKEALIDSQRLVLLVV